MGGDDDYLIQTKDEKVVAGICHARGSNVNIPPQWLVYVAVEDVTASAATCERLGGRILDGIRKMNGKDFCVIRDPAGAVLALIDL